MIGPRRRCFGVFTEPTDLEQVLLSFIAATPMEQIEIIHRYDAACIAKPSPLSRRSRSLICCRHSRRHGTTGLRTPSG